MTTHLWRVVAIFIGALPTVEKQPATDEWVRSQRNLRMATAALTKRKRLPTTSSSPRNARWSGVRPVAQAVAEYWRAAQPRVAKGLSRDQRVAAYGAGLPVAVLGDDAADRRAWRIGSKGEKVTPVVFWRICVDGVEVKASAPEIEAEETEGQVRRRFVLRYFSVFNAEQCELPA